MLNAAEKIKLLVLDEIICSKDLWVNSSQINEEAKRLYVVLWSVAQLTT